MAVTGEVLPVSCDNLIDLDMPDGVYGHSCWNVFQFVTDAYWCGYPYPDGPPTPDDALSSAGLPEGPEVVVDQNLTEVVDQDLTVEQAETVTTGDVVSK